MPVSFEIEITKNAAAAPPIKQRLEADSKKSLSLTLEDIQEKLSQAAEKRQNAIGKHVSAAKECLEKAELIRERKSSQERAQEERGAAELQSRLSIAGEKRSVQINSIQDKARTHNEMVVQRVESLHKTIQSESNNKKEQLEERLKKAAALRGAKIVKV